jgi:hypothetical protein
MTQTLHLPALDGRDPLGFLASLGILRLLAEDGVDVRLSFSEQTATAILHGPYGSAAELAAVLQGVVARNPDSVIPGVPAGFPRPKVGTKGSDPMRVGRDEYRAHVETVRQSIGQLALRWQAAIATDLARGDESKVILTPFFAPSGQQTVRSFFEKPMIMIRREPERLLEALTAWRRVPGVTGEYLDHRVLRSKADHPRGESAEIGVPGATWLAIMALPLLRLTGDGTSARSTLWRRLPGRQAVMVWPVWRLPLDLAAVVTLIEHPDITIDLVDGQYVTDRTTWSALGVFAVAGATRRPVEGRKSSGVLTPVTVIPRAGGRTSSRSAGTSTRGRQST